MIFWQSGAHQSGKCKQIITDNHLLPISAQTGLFNISRGAVLLARVNPPQDPGIWRLGASLMKTRSQHNRVLIKTLGFKTPSAVFALALH